MRILIARFSHETNTFSPVVTDWERFVAYGIHRGQEVVEAYAGTATPISAYLNVAAEAGAEVMVPLAAEAAPSGPVLRDCFERMSAMICESVPGCDLALLDLHGAMVAEGLFDAEGELLRRMRMIAPKLPIAVTCDLHCNLSQIMVENATAIVGYKTYPHVDMYAVGEQAARIGLAAAEGTSNPVMRWGQVPLLSQTLRQGHDDAPMGSILARCRDMEQLSGVLAATAFGGFALADVPDAGNSAVVVTEDDADLAERLVDELTGLTWQARADFVYRPRDLEATVAAAKAVTEGPVILLDHADNCGSGGTQDVMTVIAEVIAQELEDVAVAAVCDPEAAQELHAAGIDAEVTLALGGRMAMPSVGLAGRPLEITGRVTHLSSGRYRITGPMDTGRIADMGLTAVLDTGFMEIVVCSKHCEPYDLGIFTSVGIQPAEKRYLLLKSRIHYRAAFADLARATFTLDGDGVTTSDNSLLTYRYVRRPVYPLDDFPASQA